VLQCRATTYPSGIPATPKIEMKMGPNMLVSRRENVRKPAKMSAFQSLTSQLGGSRLLKDVDRSLALTGEARRKAVRPGQPKLPYSIQWGPDLAIPFAPHR
jgi:hypothetical protein